MPPPPQWISAPNGASAAICQEEGFVDVRGYLEMNNGKIDRVSAINPPPLTPLAIGGDLQVNGALSATSLTVTTIAISNAILNALTVSGLLNAQGGLQVSTSFDVFAASNFHGHDLTRVGTITPSGRTLTLNSDVDVQGDLNMHQHSILNIENLEIIGQILANGGTLYVSGNLALSGNLDLRDNAIANVQSLAGQDAAPIAVLSDLDLNNHILQNVARLVSPQAIIITNGLVSNGPSVFSSTVLFSNLTTFGAPVDFGGQPLANVYSVAPPPLQPLNLLGDVDMNGHGILNVRQLLDPTQITIDTPTVLMTGNASVPGVTDLGLLNVTGGSSLAGPTTFAGGPVNFDGVQINGVSAIAPQGTAIQLQGNLDMTGHNIINVGAVTNAGLTVNGATHLNGTLGVTGQSQFSGNMDIAAATVSLNGATMILIDSTLSFLHNVGSPSLNMNGAPVNGLATLNPLGATITVNGNVDLQTHNLLNVAVLTPPAGGLTIGGNTAINALTAVKIQNGSQNADYVLRSAADGTASWISPAAIQLPKGSLYFDGTTGGTGGPINVAAPGALTPSATLPATTISGPSLNFAMPSLGQLQYTGPVARLCNCTMTVTLLAVAGLHVGFYPLLDGVAIPSVISEVMTLLAIGTTSTTLTFTVTLNPNDILQLAVRSLGNFLPFNVNNFAIACS